MAGVPGVMPQFNMGGFGGGMMPGNPMLEGLLAAVAAQNPEVVSSAAAAAGIPPPTSAPGMGADMGSIGAFLQPMDPAAMQANPGAAAIGPWSTEVNPAAGGAIPNGMGGNQNLWQGLGGFKAPQAEKPIMSGGVSGAQKAPDGPSAAGGLQANQMMQQLMQQLLQRQQAPVMPLGQMIGG
jgi:hypothetical protein